MKMLSRGLILLFSLSYLSIQGAAYQPSSSSSSQSSTSAPRLHIGESLWVDPNVIKGFCGLELLFKPNEFFDDYSDLDGLDENSTYITEDLIENAKEIVQNNIDILLPIYHLFALIQKKRIIEPNQAVRYIQNSHIGRSKKSLQIAQELVNNYFSRRQYDSPLICILSIYGAKKRLIDQNGIINKVLFSPFRRDDDGTKIEETLIWLIHAENESIRVASYHLNRENIIWALHEARNRGVKVEVMTDDNTGTTEKMKQNEFSFLKWRKLSDINQMHNKFLLFSKNINNDKIVATGSYNLTNNANRQPENMIFSNDQGIYERFSHEYDRLASNCDWIPSDFDIKCGVTKNDYQFINSESISLNMLPNGPKEAATIITQAIDSQIRHLQAAEIEGTLLEHKAKKQRCE